MAQKEACWAHNSKVVGSKPTVAIKLKIALIFVSSQLESLIIKFRIAILVSLIDSFKSRCSSVGRAFDCSCYLLCYRMVPGSNPGGEICKFLNNQINSKTYSLLVKKKRHYIFFIIF